MKLRIIDDELCVCEYGLKDPVQGWGMGAGGGEGTFFCCNRQNLPRFLKYSNSVPTEIEGLLKTMDPAPSFLTMEKKFPNQILQISQDPVGILYSFRNIVKEGTKRGESDAFGNIL
jgi:hypothetical protein